jgi:YcaO-like protein with predicted kinase domain
VPRVPARPVRANISLPFTPGTSDCVDRGSRAVDLGGTIRASDVASSLAKAREVARAIGITRLANVTGLDHVGVPTWVAVRPLARSLSVSQGKGLTHHLARLSALMECIELHHAEHFVPRGHVQSLRAAAEDERYAHPLLLPIRPSATIDDASSVEWVAGRDLCAECVRWVPRDCIDIDSSSARDQEKLFVGSSNGLASGNTHDEATLHAVCEIVERDQQSCWHARKQLSPDRRDSRLRLDSVTDQNCRWLIDKCREAGLEVVVWCTTQDLRIPCFTCTLFDRHGNTYYPQRASGSGCHPYRRIALSRAITEALQSRLTHIAGGRDDMYWSVYQNRLRVDDEAGRIWGDLLVGEPDPVAFEDVQEAPAMESIEALLSWVIDALAARGFAQVIVVDLTQGQFGIPVVHASVPGLEGPITRPGYTPGPRMQELLAGLA